MAPGCVHAHDRRDDGRCDADAARVAAASHRRARLAGRVCVACGRCAECGSDGDGRRPRRCDGDGRPWQRRPVRGRRADGCACASGWRDGRCRREPWPERCSGDGRRRIRAWPGDGSGYDAVHQHGDTGQDNEGARRRCSRCRSSAPARRVCSRRTTRRSRCSTTAALIEGRYGATVAFTLTIDATTGDVTLTQLESLRHPTGGLASPDELVSLAAGALNAVLTVTDGDLDVATATVDLGNVVRFEDDAPTAALALQGGVTVVVDESLGKRCSGDGRRRIRAWPGDGSGYDAVHQHGDHGPGQ